jgi:uncharacterized phage protein (TIGR01671 family)
MAREIKFRAWSKQEWNNWWCNYWSQSDIIKAVWRNDVAIMQYTWLKDKNWKEIYEGDIVKYKAFTEDRKLKEMVKSVFFDVDFGCFMLWTEECMRNLATDDDKEIIWNIYENPELLSFHK